MRKAIMILSLCILAGAMLWFSSRDSIHNKGVQMQAGKTGLQREGLQIYLVKEGSLPNINDNTDINKLELESEPLLSRTEILSYHWGMHTVKVENNGKVNRKLLKRRFVMVVDGERIYSGVFWSALFSMVPPKISVYLDNINERDKVLFLALGSWRPGEKIPADVEKILADPRIRQVLERDSKLYKAYKPAYFKTPDYIDVLDQASQTQYGGLDWDKKDELLRLLDRRFVKELNFAQLALPPEEDAAMHSKETIIKLGYNEPQRLKYTVNGVVKTITCKELIMPITGNYGDLLFFRDDTGYVASPLGRLDKFNEIEKLRSELPVQKPAGENEPAGIHLIYYKGAPFQHIRYDVYELEKIEAEKVKKEAALGKMLKGIPAHKPQTLPLTIKFGKKDPRWFHLLDDRETLFSEGKFYQNPALAKTVLLIAGEKCEFKIFDTSIFRHLVKAKYSFRTNTRTIERSMEDKKVLAAMEKGLRDAKFSMGGGCPFSEGVLTLDFEDGTHLGISMASDDCPLMFIDGNFLTYSKELHDLLIRTFDNFPYVRR